MNKKIKILIAEHNSSDSDLILNELKMAGFHFVSKIAETENKYIHALKTFVPDIILSDYTFPAFDGPEAFKIKEQLAPDTPFIFVSGTIGEEKAVQHIKDGVSDYALKDKLFTLPIKILRALKDADKKKEKEITEEKLKRAKHLYAFISQVNQNIVRVKDETTLFRNSCKMAIEFGRFKMAWVGIFDFENKKISLVEQCGIINEDLNLFANAGYEVNGPQDWVLRTGRFFICNDIQNDLDLQSWKPYAASREINSCMVLPIKKSGNIIGTLNLYSPALNFSGEEEVKLLLELTGDISFALDLFEKEKKHKATEELILKNEKRYRALVENGADAVVILTAGGKSFYVSPTLERVLGYTEAEALNLDVFSMFHPDEITWAIKIWEQVMASPGIPIAVRPSRMMHKDGNWRWLEGTLTNLLHDPSINGIIDNFRDVTDKVEAETQKEYDSNNLNALINNTDALMWSIDTQFKLITSNKPFESMAHANFGRLISKGENILDVSHTAEMYDHFKASYERAFAGETFTMVEHFEFPSEFWTEVSYVPIYKGKEIIGAACNSRDITKKKIAEQHLIKSELSLNEAQAIANVGNWEVNFETGEALWSEETCRIYGIPPEQRVHSYHTWLSFIHPDDLDYVMAATKEAQKTLSETILNHRILLKDGSIKHIYAKSKFILNLQGKPLGLYGTTQDVTERQLADKEKEKLVSNIVQHSKNLEQFAFIVSHNLRSPVANILGLSNILKGNLSEDERIRSQNYLFNATEQLDDVLKDLNKILQLRSESDEHKEPLFFEELVKLIKSSIHILIEKEHVQITTDFSAINEITSIRSYFHSIFLNLITNSIKYRRPGITPLITIKSEIKNDKFILSFQDNGLGIDLAKHGNKVFGLYKRFHLNLEGKGLGLFMVKTQVETLGGTIKIESDINQGTQFIIELPL